MIIPQAGEKRRAIAITPQDNFTTDKGSRTTDRERFRSTRVTGKGTVMITTIEFKLNHEQIRLSVDGERTLLWVLRSDLGLTGAKYGCGIGVCGACTVLVGQEAVRSCTIPVIDVKGKDVLTIEGLARNGRLHPIQQAFVEHNALQCGFCTPGMILTAYSLLLTNPAPTEADIIAGMEDNLCRCGSQQRIVQAIQDAARAMRG